MTRLSRREVSRVRDGAGAEARRSAGAVPDSWTSAVAATVVVLSVTGSTVARTADIMGFRRMNSPQRPSPATARTASPTACATGTSSHRSDLGTPGEPHGRACHILGVAEREQHVGCVLAAGRAGGSAGGHDPAPLQLQQDRLAVGPGEDEGRARRQPLLRVPGEPGLRNLAEHPRDEGVARRPRPLLRVPRGPPPSAAPRSRARPRPPRSRCPSGVRAPARRRG